MSLKSSVFSRKNSAESGFSLIGVAVGLTIFAMLLIPYLTLQNAVNKNLVQQTNIGFVSDTTNKLRNYVLQHGAYPRPAPPALPITDVNAGLQAVVNVTSTTACPGALGGLKCTTSSGGPVLIGTLPYTELGMPASAALDRYGHKYLYAVTAGLTNSSLYGDDGGKITIVDIDGNQMFPTTPNKVHIAVVAAGENGSCAYDQNGNRSAAPLPATKEYENCNDDGKFRATGSTYLVYMAPGDTHFDDMVGYTQSAYTTSFTQKAATTVLTAGTTTAGTSTGQVIMGGGPLCPTAVGGDPYCTSAKKTPNATVEVGRLSSTDTSTVAKANTVKTTRICDTRLSTGSSSCTPVDTIANSAVTTTQCASTRGLRSVNRTALGVSGSATSSCDATTVAPATALGPAPCANTGGAKGLQADGTLSCF